jgi:hypothetical protein
MSEMTRRRAETEGRRGSRIDTDEGGRYVGIPLNGQCSVQETGCGTDRACESTDRGGNCVPPVPIYVSHL